MNESVLSIAGGLAGATVVAHVVALIVEFFKRVAR